MAARLAWRDWRSGELVLLSAALIIAVGTVTAISLFVDRLHQALLLESANLLAADRYISSSAEIPQAFRDAAAAQGLDMADVMVFPSMIFAGEDKNQLVSVKAAGEGYPLRGKLIVADAPFARGTPTTELPARGEVWLDSRLFPALGVALGDQVEVGMHTLTVTQVLVNEPDRGGSFFDMGPRLLMHLDDVPATEVVQPGSRLSYRLLLRGESDVLDGLKETLPLEPNFRWVGIQDASPRIGNALDRGESFLLLGGLLGVLLAGVAVALSAHRYAQRHYDHVGVLKTLGATPGDVLWGFLALLLIVGLVSVLVGLAAGALMHLAIVEALSAMIPVQLPLPSFRPFLVGSATGLICALAFAMPPLVHLRHISPMRVIRRDLGPTEVSQFVTYGAAAAGSLALLIWYSESLVLTLWTLLGTLGVLLVFGGLAMLMLRTSRVVGMQAASIWRLALSALQRRHRESTAQIMIFGLAMMLLSVLFLLRTALLDEWRTQIPENTPNHFVLNIAPDEVEAFDTLVATASDQRGGTYPIVRGRVVAVNDVSVKSMREAQEAAGDQSDGPRLGGERNLTWSIEAPEDNAIVAGEWWAPDDPRPQVSLEDEYALERGLALGDELTVDVGGVEVKAIVTSLRKLDWESMRPNFFIIFSPNVLDDFPATYMTSFYLPREGKRFLNELLGRFPTVTVLEVDAIIEQVQSIVDRVTQAVELVLSLVVVSGCLVLLASIQASKDARMREHALVRTLGGTRRLIRGSLAIEFAALGLMAGIVAVVGAEVTVSVLQTQVFELSNRLHPELWLTVPVLGALLIAAVGLLGTRQVVSSPPMMVLRGL